MKKIKWHFGLVQRTFFLMLFVFIIILGMISLQEINERKENMLQSSYDASLTTNIQNIYQSDYSLDNSNLKKYLNNYYLTNEGMSAIVDINRQIKTFVSSASLHVSQLWVIDDKNNQEMMIDISHNNLVKKIDSYMTKHPDENYEIVIGGSQSKQKQYYINNAEDEIEYLTSLDTTSLTPSYLSINGKILVKGSYKALKKYKVSWYMSERCFYEKNGVSGGREFTDYNKLKKTFLKQIKKIKEEEYSKASDYIHAKSVNVGHGTMYIVIKGLNQEISPENNENGVNGYFITASYIPKLYQRSIISYFKHSWYIYIVALLLDVLISIVISRLITRPLRHVSEVTSEIAKNDFDEKFLVTRHDEIGQLENNINIMSTNLENTINQLKEQLDHVKRLENTRKQFIANFTHEIKTPLGIIAGYSELLEDAETSEAREKYIRIINEQTDRINRIVLTMLDLSRLESGNIELHKCDVSLRFLVEEVIEDFDYEIGKKNIQVIKQLEDIKVNCDPVQIERVINNLTSNAIKHTETQGTIIYRLLEHRFEIENEGAHLSNQDLESIWQAYISTDQGGTGLGLPIVKAILERHGFHFGVQNTEKGVLFYFEY